MADDVVSAFGKGVVGFAHSRAGELVGDSFSGSGALVASLFDGTSGTTKQAFKKLKEDIDALSPLIEDLVEKLEKQIKDGKDAVTEIAGELGHDPFGAGEVLRALTALGKLLVAYDQAITICAETLAEQTEANVANRAAKVEAIKAEINGIHAPIKKLFSGLGGDAVDAFDRLAKFVLDEDNAASRMEELTKWDYAEKKLTMKFVAVGSSGVKPLNFDGASLEGFFQYKDEPKIGLAIRTKIKAGLRSDKMLEKIMPGEPPTADSDPVAITLDTTDGLTFGSGKDKRLVLPMRFAFPGVELREFAIEQPADDNVENRNRINVVFTVAGKIGDVFAAVVEGGGISIRWNDGADPDVTPKIPSGAGMRIDTGLVKGGGYLRYVEAKKEYGGVFQLEIAKIGVTAIGLIGTEPEFSIVIVIGVRFSPKIELGYGFTLNGIGGILAINRTLDSLELANGLKNDVVGQLLFPADPVAAAPKILDSLGKVFPFREGGFVIGPIAEIGWGSQAGFLKARLGIVLCLPDPKVVLLGALQIGVPSTELPKEGRLVDIHANLMGEITPDYFFIKVSISKSKLFKVTLTGDIAIYVQWVGEGAFALSVGGFFPGYEYPKMLGEMVRVGLIFELPFNWLSLSAVAYFAVTSNSVQFGGRVNLIAKVGPAKAEAWIQIDAIFAWAPHFHFEVRLDVGIKVSAFGATIAGVKFIGTLKGDKPFHLEGKATVEILWWDVDVGIGPIEWGEKTPPPLPTVNAVEMAALALNAPEAWTPRLPEGANRIVRLAATAPDGLTHPLGELEIKQLQIPLEYDIDRVGSAAVDARRINLRAPTLGGVEAGAVWPVIDRFSPGHFLDLSDQEVLARPEFEELQAGLGMAASRGAAFPDAVHAGYGWNTVCPGESFGTFDLAIWDMSKIASKALGANASVKAMRARANPYDPIPVVTEPTFLEPRGGTMVVRRDTLEVSAGLAEVVTASVAANLVAAEGGAAGRFTTLAKGFLG